MKFDKRAEFYFRQVIWREWKLALLLLGVAAIFAGLYFGLKDGIWNARKNGSKIVYGQVVSNRIEARFDSMKPIATMRVAMPDGNVISLRSTKEMIGTCWPQSEVEVLVYTSDAGRIFYTLGQNGCENPKVGESE